MVDTGSATLFNIAHRARRRLSQYQPNEPSLWQKLEVTNEPSDKPVRLTLIRHHESY
jgi:hypothetical protein